MKQDFEHMPATGRRFMMSGTNLAPAQYNELSQGIYNDLGPSGAKTVSSAVVIRSAGEFADDVA